MASQMNWKTQDMIGNEDGIKCRICWQEEGRMISPCNCSGTVSFVHEACITEWIQKSVRNNKIAIKKCEDQYFKTQCELCRGDIEFLYINRGGCLRCKQIKQKIQENKGGFICLTIIIAVMLFIATIIMVTGISNIASGRASVFGIVFLVIFDLVIVAVALRFLYTYINTFFRGASITIQGYKNKKSPIEFGYVS